MPGVISGVAKDTRTKLDALQDSEDLEDGELIECEGGGQPGANEQGDDGQVVAETWWRHGRHVVDIIGACQGVAWSEHGDGQGLTVVEA